MPSDTEIIHTRSRNHLLARRVHLSACRIIFCGEDTNQISLIPSEIPRGYDTNTFSALSAPAPDRFAGIKVVGRRKSRLTARPDWTLDRRSYASRDSAIRGQGVLP